MKIPAKFYPDRYAPGHQRYWDGERWTTVTRLAPRRTALLVVSVVIYALCAAVFSSSQIYFVRHTQNNYINSCLSTDQTTWSLTTSPAGITTYSGTITNTCRQELSFIAINGVGYDSGKVQVAQCQDVVSDLAAGQSAKVSCQMSYLTDQITSATIVSMH